MLWYYDDMRQLAYKIYILCPSANVEMSFLGSNNQTETKCWRLAGGCERRWWLCAVCINPLTKTLFDWWWLNVYVGVSVCVCRHCNVISLIGCLLAYRVGHPNRTHTHDDHLIFQIKSNIRQCVIIENDPVRLIVCVCVCACAKHVFSFWW